MAAIADVVAAGKEFGVFDFYLPFIIMFAVIFGILSKVKIFGEGRGVNRLNVIIAGAMSLFVMIYTPVGVTLAQFMASLFAESLIAIVTIIAILMIVYLVLPVLGIETDPSKPKTAMKGARIIIMLIVLLGIGVFISSGGLAFFPGLTFGAIPGIPTVLIPGLTSQDLALIVLGVLTVLVFWWLTKSTVERPTTQPRQP